MAFIKAGEQRGALLSRKCWRASVDASRRSISRLAKTTLNLTLDLPDNATAATISLAVKKTGAARTRTIVLLTPEEIDQAVKKPVDFQPPGWQVQDVANAIDRMIEEGGKD
jgi:hypothetical protein